MSQQESDLLFVKSYLDGINIVSNNTKGMHCGVLDLELNSIFASEWVATMGVTPEELKKLLLDPKINQYRKKAINEKKIVKILIARSLPLAGTKVAIAAYSPVFNPQTHNLVALHVSVNLLDVFNLSNILKQRVDFFNSIATMKKIEFETYIKDDIFIFCDTKKISKLIDNLLSNAIKYNKIGGTIKVVLTKNSLSIEDTGKGISQENLDNLFDRYTRFDKSVGGFGIGLNIVSLIAKEYDFKIEVSSQIDVGTKVKIRWLE